MGIRIDPGEPGHDLRRTYVTADCGPHESMTDEAACAAGWCCPKHGEARVGAVDHRRLLVKYMRLLVAEEGTTFTGYDYRTRPADEIDPEQSVAAAVLAFTDAEWAELQRLAGETGR